MGILMKKEILLAIVSFFLLSLTAITGVYAFEENAKTVTISKDKVDLTGDGQDEGIYLKGVPYQEEKSFLKKIYIEVFASNGKTYTFPLESGSKAALKLVDVNHDGLKELFASVLTGGTSGNVINFLYSLKNFVHTDLTVPEPLEMEAKFLNGYKAEINLPQTKKTYLFDLKNRKKYYKKLGFYYKGKLNEPTELVVNGYNSLEPIQLGGKKIGLKGIQQVTGIVDSDTIASVESIWLFDHGQWKLNSTNVSRGNTP